ncbi:MAG TPA: two-component system response regulator [Verrucomicrobiales bacterium]|nr:two-component system response regulator [Verrucomicrobiales bacterium]
MGRKRILFAEDDERDVELALTVLAAHRLVDAVQVVRDGAEALDYLFRRGEFANHPEDPPILTLLDLRMPKLDGLQVLDAVRRDPRLCLLRVVILTASRRESDLVRGYALGASAFVVKPLEESAFREAVEAVGLFWALLNEPPTPPTQEASPFAPS